MTIALPISLPWPFKSDEPSEHDQEDSADALVVPNVVSKQPWAASHLHHYSTPGKSPPSARVYPTLKFQERQPIRLWHLWKYGMVAASKATQITGDVLSHHIWGPRKKSWGIEMTLITSFMRGNGRHSSLVDISTIRLLMSIGGLVPLPSDALVTPVTFRVRRRQLKGILADFDAAETGRRELSGEWVVGKKTWQRLQSEWKASQSSFADEKPPTRKKSERVILYLHGGAYYVSSAAAQRLISIPLSKYADSRVFALDYRLAPETKFPGPLHDAVSGYFRLVDDLHIPPENILLAGDSAGGGLTIALLMYLRDNKYPLPSGAILMSPWVDLTMSCESWDSNSAFDVVPIVAPDDHMNPVSLYLGEHMEQYLTHPYASPLFGDFAGLPPLLIQAGNAEVLRDEITLLAHKATSAGVEVRHELYEDAVHVFQSYPFLQAATQSFLSMREFVRNILPQIQERSPQMLDIQAEKILEDEIDNESASVVRGDGVEVATGKEEVEEEFREELPTSDSDEESHQSNQLPSWGHSQEWSASDAEDESSDDSDDTEQTTASSGYRTPTVTRARSATLPGFRRIRSAMSLIISDPPTTPHRCHHRTPSLHLVNDVLGSRPRLDPIHIASRTPTSAHTSVPPSPSLRRSSNAGSYPDISVLLRNYTDSGPANHTLMYPPS